ncbi:non-ribosomal peptide synthetase component F/surfactin synthase thioesterase subunit/acyl carrier protein [Enterococcus rotai]|uniref:Carrier domain-containing protein n=1 Tax=Enterococcus rotai TaxID=118060 RepID=A0A0U2VYS8_9ENTE|nr:AMP-binding protein [Enterococcus rotai]ALS38436.1 hypothetical protein ATZ35_15155 [Enterococcus rotai]
MEIKMTEVQKAYLLGRNESFDAKTGTHMYLEVKYKGNIQEFQDALNKVIQVQPMLRAKVKNMETFEIINNFNYEIIVSSKSNDEMKSFRERTRERLSHKLYQSGDFPLYTFEAVKNVEEPSNYLIFISIDLLIADGLSLFQLFDDIKKTVKNDRVKLTDVSDLLLEINDSYLNSKKSARYEKDREYWKQKIETLPDAPNLLVKEEKASHSKFARKEYIYTAEKLSKLKEIAERRKISLNSLFLTLYSTALQQWSENKKFTINVTTFKRSRGEKYLSVIGDFTSTVLVPTDIDMNKTILENTLDTHRNIFSSFRRSSFEGIEVLRELKKRGRQPLMPYVFTSMLFDFDKFDELGEIDYWISETAQVYLDCQMKIVNGSLNISWDYLKEIFEINQIDEMFQFFIQSIDGFLLDEEIDVRSISKKLNQLIEQKYFKYNSSPSIIKKNTQSILSAFKKVKKEFPEKLAFSEVDDSITFNELDRKSDDLAEVIGREKQRYDFKKIRIGIVGKKSIESTVQMLAVIKTSDSFCFISEDMPENRYRKLLKTSNIQLLIKGERVFRAEPSLRLENEYQEIPNDELYVIFTSGTTGEPKGISISERPVLNTIDDIIARTRVNQEDVLFNVSDLSFDLSVFDLLTPLLSGCETILCPNSSNLYPFKEKILQATFWNSTPGLVQTLLSIFDCKIMNIRNILMSGDFIPADLVYQIKGTFLNEELNIFSLGGATEASIWSIYYPLNDFSDRRVPYGYPLSNQNYYVLDRNDCLVNSNVSGELVIAGEGLANGYLLKNQNHGVFYEHAQWGPIYRTGDKGYLTDEGYVNILGRMESELKVNGYRIDLIEIEHSLSSIKDISETKVVVKENQNEKKYLSAFYTTNTMNEISHEIFRSELRKVLPTYMIPSSFTHLNTLPLTSNGKINLKKLKEMEPKASQKFTEKELELFDLWTQVIDLEENNTRLTKSATFFEIGGDSIKLPELLYKINNKYNVDITIEELLNHFSLNDQARYLEKIKQEDNNFKTNQFLTQLKKGTSEKSIVFIHAGSGEIGIYNELAKNIDSKYNVFAIRFKKDIKKSAPRVIDFTKLAKEYNEYLENFESIDYLGGWCIGGTIGYEISKINSKVNNLFMINTMPPVENKIQKFEFQLKNEQQFIYETFDYKVESAVNTDELWEQIILLLEKRLDLMPKLLKIVPNELARLIPFFGESSPRELIYYINLFRSFETARHLYEDSTSVLKDIFYFGAESEKIPNYVQWRQHVKGSWIEKHISGDHTTIFEGDNVKLLARAMNQTFRKKEEKQ